MKSTQNYLSLILLSVGIQVTVNTHSQVTPVTNGLVAEYTFNNSNAIADYGGINGVENNTTITTDRHYCPGMAMEFELGLESYISLGDNLDDVFAAADSSWSISMWFRQDSIDNDYATMLTKYSHNGCATNERQFVLRMSANNEVEFGYNSTLTGIDFVLVRGTTVFTDDKWHHVVINYDGSNDANNGHDRVQMYIDNALESTVLAGSGGALGDVQDGAAHLGIGGRLDLNGNYCPISGQDHLWDGGLDDIRIYSRALSISEIDILFNEGNYCGLGFSNPSDNQNRDISVYPNPASTNITVQVNGPDKEANYGVGIYNLLGQEVIAPIIGKSSIILDVSELPASIYLIKVRNIATLEENSLLFNKR